MHPLTDIGFVENKLIKWKWSFLHSKRIEWSEFFVTMMTRRYGMPEKTEGPRPKQHDGANSCDSKLHNN